MTENRDKLEAELKKELDHFNKNKGHGDYMETWAKIKKLEKFIREEEASLPPETIRYHHH